MQSTQGHESHSFQLRVLDPTVMRAALTLELLASQSHSDPLVEFAELRHARREGCANFAWRDEYRVVRMRLKMFGTSFWS